jgi:hypothetical protein
VDPAPERAALFRKIYSLLAGKPGESRLNPREALFANESCQSQSTGGIRAMPDNAHPDGKIKLTKPFGVNPPAKPAEPFFSRRFWQPHRRFARRRSIDLYERASFIIPALRTLPEGALDMRRPRVRCVNTVICRIWLLNMSKRAC